MIPAPRMSVEIEGLDGFEARITERIAQVMPEPITFEVKASGARGGAKNAMIAHVLAATGRNFKWVNPKTRGEIALAARGLFSLAVGAKRRAEQTIGALLLVGIGENVAAQKNPGGGGFRPLTARYAAMKQRKFGRTTPIGKASGELLGGLHVEVRRT